MVVRHSYQYKNLDTCTVGSREQEEVNYHSTQNHNLIYRQEQRCYSVLSVTSLLILFSFRSTKPTCCAKGITFYVSMSYRAAMYGASQQVITGSFCLMPVSR